MSQIIDTNIVTLAPPRQITVTITEEDRQKADSYCKIGSCLMHTALSRMGYENVSVGGWYVWINGARWEPERLSQLNANELEFIGGKEKPFYAPEVVDKVIVLTRQ